jgi:hypothetical protein
MRGSRGTTHGVPLIRPVGQAGASRAVKIRVTAAGGDRTTIQTDLNRPGARYPGGTELIVPVQVARLLVRLGKAELVVDEPKGVRDA